MPAVRRAWRAGRSCRRECAVLRAYRKHCSRECSIEIESTWCVAMKDNLPWLDWLRFLAAFCVTLAHARGLLFVEYSSLQADSQSFLVGIFFAATRLGYEAVVVFFVLSGYLVGGRAFERSRAGQFRGSDYALDRITRIFLPLIPAIIFTWLVQALVGVPDGISIVLGNLFALQGLLVPVMDSNGPLWSLSYEIWFYLLCGGVATIVSRAGFVPFFLVVCSFIVFSVLEPYLLFSWLLGVAVYIWKPTGRSVFALLAAVTLASTGIVCLQLGSEGAMQITWTFLPSKGFSTLILSAGIALLISQLVLMSTPRSGLKVFFYKQGTILADFSYTLYLVHYPLFVFAVPMLGKSDQVTSMELLALCGMMLVCLIFSYVFYLAFERPTMTVRRLCRRLLVRRPQKLA